MPTWTWPSHLSRKSKRILYRSIASAFLNVTLGYLFIMKYGLIGAAYASLMSAALMGVFTWWSGATVSACRFLCRPS